MRTLQVFRGERRAHVLKDDGVEQHQSFGVAVIGLHQLFGGALRFAVLKAVTGGERGLVVEEQAIFAAAGDEMQADAQVAQEILELLAEGDAFL
ncbi:hypothetical protein SDC9_202071 [bioreactor metagenome]|uniref:Uncharacterized protein n=1 Tax=bioreactor metagenome TaxID=1076179 RepID=A0A645ISP3_9ZZZZ